MIRVFLALLALMSIPSAAHAQLVGADTKPGDACSASEEGYVRRNASADRNISEITLICDGSQWQSATGGGGLAALQGTDDSGPCTGEKDGLIRYRTGGDPKWEYCDGGTTSWLPFRLPQCQDDDAGVCTLAALRSSNDPQFKPSSIRCGDKLLGVTGTYGSGSSSPFTFTNVTNAALSSVITVENTVTVSGIPAGCPGAVEISGQGGPQVSINGGAWGSGGAISNGQTLAVRLTSSAAFDTARTAMISIGSTEEEWSVTTRAAESCTIASGTTWTVGGKTCTAPSALTVSHGSTGSRTDSIQPTTGSATWSCTDGTPTITGSTCMESCSANQTVNWSPGCTAQSGALLASGANRTITNTAAGYDGTRTITCNNGTLAQSGGSCTGTDSTPNAFSFTNQTGQQLNTLLTSNTITISGLTTGATVSVSGSGSPKISINGGEWITSGTIQNGQTLRVQLTSANAFSTARSATVNVGGVTSAWSVTTRAAANCSNTTMRWTNASTGPCQAASGAMTHGQSKSVNNSASGHTGSRNLSCNDGSISQSGGNCVSTCGSGSYALDGYCYYYGNAGQNCTTICSGRGGCDLTGTNYAGGSAPNDSRCQTLLTHFRGTSTTVSGGSTGIGCLYNNAHPPGKRGAGDTTCAVAHSNYRRICACNN